MTKIGGITWRKRGGYLPHHGRGGYRHIGRVRIKLAKILNECLDVICEPEDLSPSGGRQRNNTTTYDGYAWEVTCRRKAVDVQFWAGSFDTMTDCVKAGKVSLIDGEISAG